jgi:hypothetical protein
MQNNRARLGNAYPHEGMPRKTEHNLFGVEHVVIPITTQQCCLF